jgi:hypothetical protein
MANCSAAYRTTAALLASITLAACTLRPPSAASGGAPAASSRGDALKTQARVMGMADDYIAALGESVYLVTRSGVLDSKGRWLAQSLDQRISSMTDPAEAIVDRMFWRGVILIGLLIAGIGLLRLVPQRITGRRRPELDA